MTHGSCAFGVCCSRTKEMKKKKTTFEQKCERFVFEYAMKRLMYVYYQRKKINKSPIRKMWKQCRCKNCRRRRLPRCCSAEFRCQVKESKKRQSIVVGGDDSNGNGGNLCADEKIRSNSTTRNEEKWEHKKHSSFVLLRTYVGQQYRVCVKCNHS